ncbi:MAG: flavodoxin-dependent (E)-4-hydroxy-3-methylbut-2-enyl-diphosphate synthase [Syntrophobacterales bacterium]|nr:MAG: flavodoxin-dependent (E)-4-hydroxy-3-methylbut-2-enyl-diphosphate synthase [Syntrophobacterales bacterium]
MFGDMERKRTRQISIGGVKVGGDAPISVQSMTKTDTRDVDKTVAQIQRLEAAGCEIVRVAIPDKVACERFGEIRARIELPLVADIHFDHRLAIKAVERGADAIRINPGTIRGRRKIEDVVGIAKGRGIPIRIGINAGSLEKDLLRKYGGATPEAMVESALRSIHFMETLDFHEIKVSLKASDVIRTIEAYRLISREVDYPLHLGVTEAGTVIRGTIKSSIGIGLLLYEGIGDTLRVSLTGDPVEEVRVGFGILRALNLRQRGPDIISCPTCGRCEVDLIPMAEEVERRLSHLPEPIRVAVMGCVVNGPGEAREADVGIAGGRGVGLLFREGKVLSKYPQEELIQALIEEIEKMLKGYD